MSSEIYFFDLEIFKSLFTNTLIRKSDGKVFQYAFHKDGSRWDSFNDMLSHYKEDNWMVGYNSRHFDDRIIEWIKNYLGRKGKTYSTKGIISDIYHFTQKIINDETDKYKWGNNISFNSIDLMKTAHLEKSLKMVAVNLEHDLIQDLPFEHDAYIQSDQVEDVLEYNLNDVEITKKLYYEIHRDIKLRKYMSNKYNMNLMTHSNSDICKKLLGKLYKKNTGENFWRYKNRDLSYDKVDLGDIVSDKISFSSDSLLDLKESIDNTVLNQDEDGNFESFEFKVNFKGTRYKVARGGIHSENEYEIYESDDEYVYRELDWSSFYPFIMMELGIYPSHLDKGFLDIFSNIVNERLKYKAQGKTTESNALKIVINSAFGKYGDKYSWMYDPKAMFGVTINGQLLMLMLIEIMEENNFPVCYANTDGIFVKVKRDRYEEFCNLYEDFEDYTGFIIDDEAFNKLVYRDVNNYLLEKKNGSIKRAGALDKDGHKGSWGIMKSFDKPVVAEAIENYFFEEKSVKETIEEKKSPMNFCMAQKAGKKFDVYRRYIEDGELKEEQVQRTNRYFISDAKGDSILKKDGDREISMAGTSGEHILLYNEQGQHDRSRVKDKYYEKEALKIIRPFENRQQSLF